MFTKVLCLVAVLAACEANAVRTARNVRVNKYYVYTKDNHREPFELDETNIDTSPIVATDNTVVIIHGHEGSSTTSLNPVIVNAFLTSEDVNVIVVDWSIYASLSYSNAVVAVPSVGANLAQLLILLESTPNEKIEFSRLHIVGFGLGAHAAGFAGRDIQRLVDQRVARITGLDPSGSQWESNSQRLSSSDARYVEVIHTDGSGLHANGIGIQLGHVDFFVNGGGNQPGCLTNACSHNRAYEVFSSSLTHGGLVGKECKNNVQLALNLCNGYNLPLGNNEINKFGDGMFRVNTGRSYPF